jgi:hypothetical protein
MPILNSIVKIATKPVPRVLSPKAHAFIDWVRIGSFLAGAAFFWRRSKRAALAAVICGAAELSVSLLTDYPGGVKRIISFRKHGEIDLGLAAMSATMPEFLVFKGDPERKFFLAQGILITAANEITQFPKKPQQAEKGARRARAA